MINQVPVDRIKLLYTTRIQTGTIIPINIRWSLFAYNQYLPQHQCSNKAIRNFNNNFLIGHLNSAMYVISYLKSIASYDIRYNQGNGQNLGNVGIRSTVKDKKLLTFAGLNRGTQNIFQSQPNKT